jgi:hypothetical protein
MKSLILIASAALVAGAAFAQTQSTGSDKQGAAKDDPNETVCRSMRESGSRLKGVRVCMTRAQWTDLQRQQRLDTEVSQNRRAPPR